MAKADICFVRNEGYGRDKIPNLERHNERKNQHYGNGDVDLSRAGLNVHFKRCDGTYLETFDRMVEDGAISTWNLKKDPKIIDEFIFDVNTEYFDRNGAGNPGGSYEYAKRFYEEAYRFAVTEAGGEEYILSAVMHADERNKALSEQLGRDVYHYHLHVMYIPVVDTEIKWTKRCKDPALVGTVKAVIKQVSNSKKWKSEMVLSEDGKQQIAYSYSALQDRFHQHMLAAGYTDVERGERGSGAEHLNVLDFKIKQDTERSAALSEDISVKENQAAALDKKTRQAQTQLNGLQKKVKVTKQAGVMFSEIGGMVKKTLGGKYQISPGDWETVSELAKKGILADASIADLKRNLASAAKNSDIYKERWEKLSRETEAYRRARQLDPAQTRAALDYVMKAAQERPQIIIPQKQRSRYQVR